MMAKEDQPIHCPHCGTPIGGQHASVLPTCEKCGPVRSLSAPDFYHDESGRVVFTRAFHLKRGYCCKSSAQGCRHCPYRNELP